MIMDKKDEQHWEKFAKENDIDFLSKQNYERLKIEYKNNEDL